MKSSQKKEDQNVIESTEDVINDQQQHVVLNVKPDFHRHHDKYLRNISMPSGSKRIKCL